MLITAAHHTLLAKTLGCRYPGQCPRTCSKVADTGRAPDPCWKGALFGILHNVSQDPIQELLDSDLALVRMSLDRRGSSYRQGFGDLIRCLVCRGEGGPLLSRPRSPGVKG